MNSFRLASVTDLASHLDVLRCKTRRSLASSTSGREANDRLAPKCRTMTYIGFTDKTNAYDKPSPLGEVWRMSQATSDG